MNQEGKRILLSSDVTAVLKYDILISMLRTRRLYAYSEKLYLYFSLILLFGAGLFSFNLFFETTGMFLTFSTRVLNILASTGLLYGAYLIVLLIFILLKDGMFLLSKIVRTLLHMSLCSIILFLVQTVYTLSAEGIRFHLM